jgi:hypothetical protein
MDMSGQLHTPAHFTPGKEMRDLLNRRLYMPQPQSGRFLENRKTSSQTYVIVSSLKLNDTTLFCTAYRYEVSVQVMLMLYAC